MAKSGGWIKIDRGILDHWIYKADKFDNTHAFIDLLLMANFAEHEFVSKGKLMRLAPGQLITSIPILARRWGWSENKVRRFLGVLVEGDVVRVDGSPRGSTLTIVNWDKYQVQRQTGGRSNGRVDGSADGRDVGSLYKNDKEGKEGEEARARARGGSHYKTQAEKSAATRALVERLDREEREREQKRDA